MGTCTLKGVEFYRSLGKMVERFTSSTVEDTSQSLQIQSIHIIMTVLNQMLNGNEFVGNIPWVSMDPISKGAEWVWQL